MTPPVLPGHIWRPLHPVDLPALRNMLDECAIVDGERAAPRQRNAEQIETHTLAAVANDGRIAAYVWVLPGEIEWYVHPDYRGRGIEAFVQQWGAARLSL